MSLLKYTLQLADNALILGHRNSEWTGHGPMLEQDIALSNISLDLIGQARYFYQYAAQLKNDGTTEDHFAFLRDSHEFLNCLMAEQENGDWGKTILRQFCISAYMFPLYNVLEASVDKHIAAIAAKSLKEATYHLRWSSEWVIRLGRGTADSKARMTRALNELWTYTDELVTPAPYELPLVAEGIAPSPEHLKKEWVGMVNDVLTKAGLQPPSGTQMQFGGKQGKHTLRLNDLLNEMQFMQRTYPGMEW